MPEQDSVDQACQEHDPPPLSNVTPPQVEPPALHGLVIGDFVIEGIEIHKKGALTIKTSNPLVLQGCKEK